MYGYIYMTTNLTNNKKYIGKHKSDILDEKYLGSGKVLHYAINKYGKKSFKCEILEWCETLSELNEREKYWISFYKAIIDHKFYNILPGGDGGCEKGRKLSEEHKKKIGDAQRGVLDGPPSIETRKKLSKSLKGHIVTEQTREKIRKANIGKKHSEETKLKISMNNKMRNPEVIEKMKASLKLSQERRAKQRLETMKKKYPNGFKQSEESNRKRSETMRGHKKSEQTKQKMRKPKSPEHIEHMRQAQKEAWKRRKERIGEDDNPF